MASVPAFLNGKYLPLEDCRVSVLDRGFLFGDGIYELITVYQNKAFLFSPTHGSLSAQHGGDKSC